MYDLCFQTSEAMNVANFASLCFLFPVDAYTDFFEPHGNLIIILYKRAYSLCEIHNF